MATSAPVRPDARRRRSVGGEGLYALWLLTMGGFVAIVLATVTGKISLLVEHSDSMAPAVRTGDLLVMTPVRPYEIAPRDIVTFRDPQQHDLLVTHRVVSVSSVGERYSVVTRGDANDASEQWSIPADGTLGRLALRVPAAGWPLKWLGQPGARLVVGLVLGLAITLLILRGIWHTNSRVPAHRRRSASDVTRQLRPSDPHAPIPPARAWWPFTNACEEEKPPWKTPRQAGSSPVYSASPDGRDGS